MFITFFHLGSLGTAAIMGEQHHLYLLCFLIIWSGVRVPAGAGNFFTTALGPT